MPERDPSTSGNQPRLRPNESTDTAEPLPAAIGRYRILRLLGEGGMGAVYEAEQTFPHRTVALKVIRAGYATSEMLRRFENEDTPFGRQPYLAMELVNGQSLLDYCHTHRLDLRQRLELMAKICDAVVNRT